MSNEVNNFSFAEEVWHAVTHGVGFLLGIAALVLLIVFSIMDQKSMMVLLSVLIYGITLVIMYGSSTLYHASHDTALKQLFQKFDHSAIYFLIAGTYTPVMLVIVGGVEGWMIFGIEWTIVLIGVTLKFLYPGRFELFSLLAYLVMGWLIVFVFDSFKANMDPRGFWLIVAGGIAYTSGIIFYVKDNIRYFHAIWHLFVLAGSILQFFAILLYIA